jgi:hypothetical protein
MLDVLEADFRRIPELLGRAAVPAHAAAEPVVTAVREPLPATEQQLGLF